MKKDIPALFTLCLFMVFSCKKNDSSFNNANSFTSITAPTPVNTKLGVYAYNNNQAYNPYHLFTYNNGIQASINYNTDFDGFIGGPFSYDNYFGHLAYNTTNPAYDPGYWQYKSFTASSNYKNYVGFKIVSFVNTGNVKNLGGPMTLNLPGHGTLAFPAEAFSSLGLDINYNINVNYLDPTVEDFAVSLPSLPFADVKGMRWFLDSYGVYQIRAVLSYCNCNIISSEDFFEKEVTMQMPIPSAKQTLAPDSIEAWHLEPHTLTWQQDGFAYKKNGVYEKKIRRYGVWNFAKPQKAVYVTLQLRTTNDLGLPNTRFVVKTNGNEIAEGRTDIGGNALILVPVNQSLSFNIINDHYLNYLKIQVPDQNIGSFASESAKKIVLPDRTDIGTLEGSVYKCDGSSFGNGMVVISQTGAKDQYVVSISNGKFTTANWLSLSFGSSTLSFLDANGNKAFDVVTYLGSEYITHLKSLRESFYACATIDSLYCNYQLDNIANSIHGDVNRASPVLVAKSKPGSTEISISDGNKGISFFMWILGIPTGIISKGLPLTVNNVACNYDPNGSSELTIYRNDGGVNGFMEGWFAIDYLDANNSPHKASGNFRLKISK